MDNEWGYLIFLLLASGWGIYSAFLIWGWIGAVITLILSIILNMDNGWGRLIFFLLASGWGIYSAFGIWGWIGAVITLILSIILNVDNFYKFLIFLLLAWGWGIYSAFVSWGWIGALITVILPIILIIGIGYFLNTTTNSSSSSLSSSPSSPPPPHVNFPIPDDINNILIEISKGEIKDPVTQEGFTPGQKVYLCHLHRFAYHEDSWQDNGYKCIQCGDGNKTKLYTLPTPINLEQNQIKWEELK